MTSKPTKDDQDRFDDAIDDATHAVLVAFEYAGLPEGDQLSDLMIDINDALASVMADWK